jgi:hypothetical protein
VTSAEEGHSSAPVPRHVAWVGDGPAPAAGAGDAALLALVDGALALGVEWLTLQEPSLGRVLVERAGDLAARGVLLDGTPRAPAALGGAPPSAAGPSLTVVIAPGRSGRAELVQALRVLAQRSSDPGEVSEAAIAVALGVPDVDLLVLTGADLRIPDLHVWQVAYSEIVVLDEPWFEAGRAQFDAAVTEYRRRDRRYGGLVAGR